jgi:hypothetical protein
MVLCEESIYTNYEIRMKVGAVTALAVKVTVPWNVIPGNAVTYAPTLIIFTFSPYIFDYYAPTFQTNLLPPPS